MKKLILLAILLPAISLADITANLKYGSQGTQVVELQEFLIEKGFLLTKASGYFFSLTRNAVEQFQESVGLPNTGYVGVLTRGQINSAIAMENASSTEAEIAETGTTTPPVIEPTQQVATPVQVTQPTVTPAPQPVQTQSFGSISSPVVPISMTYDGASFINGTTTASAHCGQLQGNIWVQYNGIHPQKDTLAITYSDESTKTLNSEPNFELNNELAFSFYYTSQNATDTVLLTASNGLTNELDIVKTTRGCY